MQYKKLIDKIKNEENIPSLKVVKVVLVQWNLVGNQYQQKSEVLYTFTPNSSYTYLLNVDQSNLVFLKTYNTEFDEIIITFSDENGSPLEIEDKLIWHCLLNRNEAIFYRTKNKKLCEKIRIFAISVKI